MKIILNIYGTFIPTTGEPYLRKGFLEFMRNNDAKNIIVYSRKPKENTLSDLKKAGLADAVKLYALEDMRKYFSDEQIPSNLTLEEKAEYIGQVVTKVRKPETYIAVPPLREIAYETKIPLSRMILISNYKYDIEEALCERLGEVFLIPEFKQESEDFSFDRIKIYSLNSFIHSLFYSPVKVK